VLRRGAEHLTNTGWARMLAGIDAGDQGATSLPAGLPLKSCAPSTVAATATRPPAGSTTGLCSASTLAYPNAPICLHDHHLAHRISGLLRRRSVTNGPVIHSATDP
jgi:hypothetical protein